MPKFRKYYFGRLNIIAEYGDYEEKKNLLYDIVESGGMYRYGDFRYTFAETDIVEDESGRDYLTAFFVKFSEVGEDETVDPEEQSLGKETVENKTRAKVRFFLNSETGLVVHNASGSDLPASQFRNRFPKLIMHSREEGFIRASMQVITDEYSIFEEIEKFKSINRLEVSLHPSNPNMNPEWEKIDESLKRREADEYYERFKSDGGLNVEDEEEIRSKLSMAKDGYGRGEFEGIDEDGEEKVVATDDTPATSEVPLSLKDPLEIIDYLYGSIRSVMSRFTND